MIYIKCVILLTTDSIHFLGTFDKDDETCADIAEFSACGTKLVIETVSYGHSFHTLHFTM